MQDTITKQQQFAHPIAKVWNAISVAEEISNWFIKADFRAEPGYKYTFNHDTTTIFGKVLKANPVHELVYTWTVKGTTVETTVSWRLEEAEGGTLLTIEHSGISQYDGETAVVMFNNYSNGWISCVENLGKYLS